VIAAVLAQVVVPLVALANSPSQFGFQMYSGAGWTEIRVEHSDGSVRHHQLSDYAALDRMDVDWTRRLPEHVCRVDTTAITVTVERWRGVRTVRCS
jgi:hypothetical protein